MDRVTFWLDSREITRIITYLLSKSAEGMQEKLDKLSAFCTDWFLDINIKKNKILIFNKAGKHLSHKFVFQNNNLECVSRYKYLGIWFNNSGSFNFAQNKLYQKALNTVLIPLRLRMFGIYFRLEKSCEL